MRKQGILAALVAAAVTLTAGTGEAVLDKCQKRIQGEGAKLQKAITGGVSKCLDAIQKEKVKGSGLGNCSAGNGCVPNAAKFCEIQIGKVYLSTGDATKSAFGKFRAAMQKSIDKLECTEADFDVFTGLEHLLSGAESSRRAAPPTTGSFAKFTIDSQLLAIENTSLKQVIYQVPSAIALIAETIAAVDPAGKKTGTVCSAAAAVPKVSDFRPNLCRFGLQCREHACVLGASSKAQLVHPILGDIDLAIAGSLSTEICEAGPGGSTPSVPGLGAGQTMGTQANTLYLLGGAQRTLRAVGVDESLLGDNGVAGVCVDILRSEGWCDCSGQSIRNSLEVCRDKDAPATGNDSCGAPAADAVTDDAFPSLKNGPLVVTSSGASQNGDCVDLLTLSVKLVLDAEVGADGLACTSDDLSAPLATLSVPGTTGTASAVGKDAIVTEGSCSTTASQACVNDADCPSGETCGGALQEDLEYSITGTRGTCANYRASNLSGVTFVGAAPIFSIPTVGDANLGITIACE